MDMKFLIATHNMKKRDEVYRILSPLGIDVNTSEQLGIEITDVDETGETFYVLPFWRPIRDWTVTIGFWKL